uniref:Uncharacterized protein n=1 Tax=Rhizophora mucronata TaxID=61149 RepID=A0A2P2MXP4_RHIMU
MESFAKANNNERFECFTDSFFDCAVGLFVNIFQDLPCVA